MVGGTLGCSASVTGPLRVRNSRRPVGIIRRQALCLAAAQVTKLSRKTVLKQEVVRLVLNGLHGRGRQLDEPYIGRVETSVSSRSRGAITVTVTKDFGSKDRFEIRIVALKPNG